MQWTITTKLGIVVALAMSVAVMRVSKARVHEESVAYNMFALSHPFMFPSVVKVFDKTLEEQIDHFNRITQNMEKSASESAAKFMGAAVHSASYGPDQTRVAYLSVSAPTTLDTTESTDHLIPIMCTCPHDASENSNLPIVLYYFGGGLVLGSIQSEILLTRWLVKETNTVVCSIGYRTSPEFPYPTPINNALDGARAILDQQVNVEKALGVGVDFNRVATWGVSSGGYMAAHAARQLTEKDYQFKCQISLVPMVKPHSGTQSMIKYWHGMYSGFEITYAWTSFLPGDDGSLAADWKVSLLVDPPSKDIISRLPPTFIQIHSKDILHDEGAM